MYRLYILTNNMNKYETICVDITTGEVLKAKNKREAQALGYQVAKGQKEYNKQNNNLEIITIYECRFEAKQRSLFE